MEPKEIFEGHAYKGGEQGTVFIVLGIVNDTVLIEGQHCTCGGCGAISVPMVEFAKWAREEVPVVKAS